MKIIETKIKGVFIIEPKVFGDERGYFFESFNARDFNAEVGSEFTFVQDNQSKSGANVLRGLHFQKPPYDQGKLVRVTQGSVKDVIVDIRTDSETYGEHIIEVLDTKNHRMLWIPPGMAHGFVSLEAETIFTYKCTGYYHPESEGCILWSDADLNINWDVTNPIISDKDKIGEVFSKFNSPF